jgi:hypothetical protein
VAASGICVGLIREKLKPEYIGFIVFKETLQRNGILARSACAGSRETSFDEGVYVISSLFT